MARNADSVVVGQSEAWVPSLGDRVRSVESGHDATVTQVNRQGSRIWLTLDFGTHLAVAGPADVYLLTPLDDVLDRYGYTREELDDDHA